MQTEQFPMWPVVSERLRPCGFAALMAWQQQIHRTPGKLVKQNHVEQHEKIGSGLFEFKADLKDLTID